MEGTSVVHLEGKDFDAEVLKSQLPTLVDFYADWCAPCRMVSPILESMSKEYNGKVKFVKVNTDDNQDLAMKYDIMSIPTVMIFKDGEVKSRIIGAAPAAMYKQKIEAALR